MKEKLIQLNTAKLAKQKGFNLLVYDWYCTERTEVRKYKSIEKKDFNSDTYYTGRPKLTSFSAPTQSLLQTWLRTKYIIIIETYALIGDDNIDGYYSVVYKFASKTGALFVELEKLKYDSWEESLEAGLLAGLNLIE